MKCPATRPHPIFLGRALLSFKCRVFSSTFFFKCWYCAFFHFVATRVDDMARMPNALKDGKETGRPSHIVTNFKKKSKGRMRLNTIVEIKI